LNGGLVEHELTLGDEAVQTAWARADAAVTPPAPFATAPPASVPPGTGGLRVLLGSGERADLAYTVPSIGSLALVCHLPGHVERGMTGAVELRAAPVAGRAPPPSADDERYTLSRRASDEPSSRLRRPQTAG
jgi:uncharacterized cupredoxin-like copper-binding protein